MRKSHTTDTIGRSPYPNVAAGLAELGRNAFRVDVIRGNGAMCRKEHPQIICKRLILLLPRLKQSRRCNDIGSFVGNNGRAKHVDRMTAQNFG